MVKFKLVIAIFIFCFSGSGIVFADWFGPQVVINTDFGKSKGQIGFFDSTSDDDFPRTFSINNKNEIFIHDYVNKRLLKYDKNGVLKDHDLEFGSILIHRDGDLIISKGVKRFFYNADEKLLKNIEIEYEGPYLCEQGYWFRQNDVIKGRYVINYHVYSTKGKYVGKYNKNDSEIIHLKEVIRISEKNNKIIKFRFSNDSYEFFEIENANNLYDFLFKDNCNNFYLIEGRMKPYWRDYSVHSKRKCSNEIIKYDLPNGKMYYDKKFINLTIEKEYGEPIISYNGNIYCWKRTPDSYSILKWTWKESPDSPLNLSFNVSKNQISLSWEAPELAKEKIKEYIVLRSSEICDSYEGIGKTKNNQKLFIDRNIEKGKNYFYKIKGIKMDGENTGFSNKISVMY